MSESDDSDFDPNTLVQSEVDSVTAEEFHERDAVPDHECSDVERPPARELPQHLLNGERKKVPNSADNASLPEDAKLEAHNANGDTGVVAKNSNTKKGMDGEKENLGSVANGGSATTSLKENGISSGDTKADEKVALLKPKVNDVLKGGEINIIGNPAKDETKGGIVQKSNEVKDVAEAKKGDAKDSSNGKGAEEPMTDSKAAGTSASLEVGKAVATAKAAAAAVTAKQAKSDDKNVDDLWKQMNQPIVRKQKRTADSGLGNWLQSERPKKRISLPRLDEAAEKSARERDEADEARRKAEEEARMSSSKKRVNLGTGLEAVLKAAKGGDNGPNTLDRTKQNWKEFKKTDTAIEEELEAHKKDKSRYTDRVEFLKRTEMREWEVEQAGKKSRR